MSSPLHLGYTSQWIELVPDGIHAVGAVYTYMYTYFVGSRPTLILLDRKSVV